MYKKYIKRFLDIILSFFAIIILLPVFIVVAILIKVKLGSPVIFTQKRPGINEKIFKMYKFRSMTNKKDENGNLLPDKVRLTSFGKKLRSTSLDELPELFNILKGDMSFVGPRPFLFKDVIFMTAEQRRRHSICPGLTGLAQINGRNNISWEKKIEYDLEYIDNGITFINDVKILFITIIKVLKRNDVNREGTVSDMDFGDWLLKEGKITREEYLNKQAKEIIIR